MTYMRFEILKSKQKWFRIGRDCKVRFDSYWEANMELSRSCPALKYIW